MAFLKLIPQLALWATDMTPALLAGGNMRWAALVVFGSGRRSEISKTLSNALANLLH
jgi:hypothetical protein